MAKRLPAHAMASIQTHFRRSDAFTFFERSATPSSPVPQATISATCEYSRLVTSSALVRIFAAARLKQTLHPSAIHRRRRSINVARALRRKKRHKRGKFFRPSDASHRYLRAHRSNIFSRESPASAACFLQDLEPVRQRIARANVVHRNSVRAKFIRQRPRQPATAARNEFERISPSTGCFTVIEVIVISRPQRRSRIFGRTSRAK